MLVNFHADDQAIGLEGDDELEAEFLALTRHTAFPDGGIVVVHWADGIVALRPDMAPSEIEALRG